MDLFDKAIEALERGKLDEGVAILQELREEMPDEPVILYNLGMAYSDLGLLHKALEALRKCVELRGDPHDHTALGVAYFRNKDFTKAKKEFEIALQQDPDDFYALRNLGVILAQSGDVQGAIDRFTHAHRIQPNAPEVMYALGQAYEQLKDISTADEWYKKTIEQKGEHPSRALAKEARTRIAGSSMKSSGFRMDGMFYCLAALQKYEGMSNDEILTITGDIALLGQRGLDIHNSDKQYRLKSMEGEFSGFQLLCYMYVGFKIIEPSLDAGVDLQDEYEAALKMHKGGKSE